MKKLKSWLIVGLLVVATLLSLPSNAFAQATAGNSVTYEQNSGQFSVPAQSETGVTFTNKTNKEVKLSVSTEGTWSLGSSFPSLDAKGFPQTYLGEYAAGLKYPDKAASSLLAINAGTNPPSVIPVGTKNEITLAPNGVLTFVNNDIVSPKSFYADNTGTITVKWSTPPVPKPFGKIVVNGDEWTLSDAGFQYRPDAATFILNIAKWFSGEGKKGKFHGYSSNFGLTQSQLADILTKAGYTWTVGKNIPFDLPTLLKYDGIFVGGDTLNNQVLIDYVKAGGNVYLMAGTGAFGNSPKLEADAWNTFLNAFGLKFVDKWVSGNNASVSSSHPIFTGVKSIYLNAANITQTVDPASKTSQIILQDPDKNGLVGVFAQ